MNLSLENKFTVALGWLNLRILYYTDRLELDLKQTKKRITNELDSLETLISETNTSFENTMLDCCIQYRDNLKAILGRHKGYQ